ncbi:unnamed protein product [Prunus armeniaca]|uniref:Uncharacterized protein n=1 Tax=Prunus armeniaca TaxID=36596 RepID=A0A6J5W9Y3_PRUAR|nr:unnamed protein product [Prunus armeniaca]CAB4296394.1 unnamed protein product [Prunus armeniaca]
MKQEKRRVWGAFGGDEAVVWRFDSKCVRRRQKAMREFFHWVGLFVLGDAIPWLSWLDLGGQYCRRTGQYCFGMVGGAQAENN